jgi:hypothetical protein
LIPADDRLIIIATLELELIFGRDVAEIGDCFAEIGDFLYVRLLLPLQITFG